MIEVNVPIILCTLYVQIQIYIVIGSRALKGQTENPDSVLSGSMMKPVRLQVTFTVCLSLSLLQVERNRNPILLEPIKMIELKNLSGSFERKRHIKTK